MNDVLSEKNNNKKQIFQKISKIFSFILISRTCLIVKSDKITMAIRIAIKIDK